MFTLVIPEIVSAAERGLNDVGKSSTRGLGGGMPHKKDHAKTETSDRRFEKGNPMKCSAKAL